MLEKNQMGASLFEFVSKTLLERYFFQNESLSITFIHIANDVIKAIKKEQTEKFSLSKELSVLYKQALGKELTKDEKKYNSQLHNIDVMGEILNGIKLSFGYSLIQNISSSILSSISNRLYSHIPSILGYTGINYLGPYIIPKAIETALSKVDLPENQKNY